MGRKDKNITRIRFFLWNILSLWDINSVMAKIEIEESFRQYLLSAYPVDEAVLDRLIDDLGEYFLKDRNEFIVQRHQFLHREGRKNEEIYRQIQKELKNRPFAGPEMSLRQIRRAIYG